MLKGNDIKITVIVPFYNVEKYINICLESILQQTLKEIEIICIDDGSVDQSMSILEDYKKKDERIVVLQQKNCGAGLARNAGIRIAKGRYIAFMDADDWYPKDDVLEALFVNAIKNKALICGGELVRTTANGACVGNISIDNEICKEGFVYYRKYQKDCYFYTYIYDLTMIKINKIYFPSYKKFEDPPFLVKAMISANKFYKINKNVYCYRVTPKKVIWDKEKANDLVAGIIDTLILSRNDKLERLHESCIKKIEEELFFYIIKNFNEDNLKMNYLLLKANEEIDVCLINRYKRKNLKKKTLTPLKIGMNRYQSIYYYIYILMIYIKKIKKTLKFIEKYGLIYTLEKIKTRL